MVGVVEVRNLLEDYWGYYNKMVGFVCLVEIFQNSYNVESKNKETINEVFLECFSNNLWI